MTSLPPVHFESGPEVRPQAWAWRTAIVATFVAGALYAALAQSVFYKADGQFLVFNLDAGRCQHPYNVLYMPLLCALHGILGGYGFTPFESARALSVVGASLGVGITALALSRSGLSRGRLWVAATLVACAPAYLFFASVVEHHAPFMPFAALCFLLTAETARARGRAKTGALAVALGLSTHLAYLVHGTGNLLPAICLPLLLAWREAHEAIGRTLLAAVIAGSVHLIAFFALRELELPGGGVDAALQTVLDRGIGHPRSITHLPGIVWHEWLQPFALLSISWLAAIRLRSARFEVAALALGLVPYLGICVLLIVDDPEFGAYLLPLAIPAARLTALSFRIDRSIGIALVNLTFAVLTVSRHDDPTDQLAWARDIVERCGDSRPSILLGGPVEIGYALAALPTVERFPLASAAATLPGGSVDAIAFSAAFDAYVASRSSAGKTVVLTAGAVAELSSLAGGAELLEQARRRHDLQPVSLGSSSGWIISR